MVRTDGLANVHISMIGYRSMSIDFPKILNPTSKEIVVIRRLIAFTKTIASYSNKQV
jgi:hypothetical protein